MLRSPLLGLFHSVLYFAHLHAAAVGMPTHHIAFRYSSLLVLSSVFLMIPPLTFLFKKGVQMEGLVLPWATTSDE